ncbi:MULTISPECIES: GreA/GreB family elongation factor [Sphingomonadales]|uniref:Nucleoside-diphosphate kinase n=2 Tax=Edaphosphingomonas TaxID=3423724 RepID=A0A2T4I671_9SPHN|nr:MULTISPECIES: GreA/GreB family elongation factor [Sphingomonas]AGH48380.1 GreA/GreB family elongation factor [Sphingomonas sp. MM-1]MDX3883565.1 GreA/GreB family elongation factor [Sphingomonas sp.]OHT20853.1 Transcription elongation factor GreB [Sphingomonas haloaromaticamans]PTD26128.1 nucleoside-diphosphate kinase [Sphingomonas fennica]
MSVAFRRDSDEEHKEPRPELPIPVGPNLVTPRGLALIEAKAAEREAALADLVAAGGGEEAIEAIRRELRYWHVRRATAQVTAPPADPEEAGFGSRVTYKQAGETRTVDIVGDDEADPAAGRIAFTAPLARALIGAGVGDKVDFAGRPEALKLVAVAPIPED